MRTKTLVLSALLGAIGTVAVQAQTNVYSLNAVGYINATLYPGFNIVTCPLITSPDNTVGSVFNNSTGVLNGSTVYFYDTSSGTYSSDVANTARTHNANGWTHNGTNVLSPGTACWFLNGGTTNLTNTFVGTVPTGTITNTLLAGFNLVGSVLPATGDLVSNTLTTLNNYNVGDDVYTFNPTTQTFFEYISGTRGNSGHNNNWTAGSGDPTIANVYEGVFYLNNGATVNWVESYSVGQ